MTLTPAEIVILCVCIVLGLAAILAGATLWAEPRDYEPEPPKKSGPLDFDEERL